MADHVSFASTTLKTKGDPFSKLYSQHVVWKAGVLLTELPSLTFNIIAYHPWQTTLCVRLPFFPSLTFMFPTSKLSIKVYL